MALWVVQKINIESPRGVAVVLACAYPQNRVTAVVVAVPAAAVLFPVGGGDVDLVGVDIGQGADGLVVDV